nr:65_t:CDS:2 [Entrophospora candida]
MKKIRNSVDLIEYHNKGCFGEIHSAYWLSDPLSMWDRDLEPKMCENNFPKVFIDLMRRCWESDLKRRPTAKELFEITGRWVVDICDNPSSNETSRQFDDAEDKKFLELEKKPFSQPTIHPLAIYTSRLLDFPGIRST